MISYGGIKIVSNKKIRRGIKRKTKNLDKQEPIDKENEKKGLYKISGEYGNTLIMKPYGIQASDGRFVEYPRIIHILDKGNISRQNTVLFGLAGMAASRRLRTVEILYDTDKFLLRDVNKDAALRFIYGVKEKINAFRKEQPLNQTPAIEKPKLENIDPVERIRKAKELYDIGAITEDEYNQIKEKYINLI